MYGGGVNGYNYANNDPINNNDPDGRLSQEDKNTIYVGAGAVGITAIVIGGYYVTRYPPLPLQNGALSSTSERSSTDVSESFSDSSFSSSDSSVDLALADNPAELQITEGLAEIGADAGEAMEIGDVVTEALLIIIAF